MKSWLSTGIHKWDRSWIYGQVKMFIFQVSSIRGHLISDGNDPKEKEGLILQKRKEITEEDSLR